MTQKLKSMLALILVFSMSFSLLSVNVWAAETGDFTEPDDLAGLEDRNESDDPGDLENRNESDDPGDLENRNESDDSSEAEDELPTEDAFPEEAVAEESVTEEAMRATDPPPRRQRGRRRNPLRRAHRHEGVRRLHRRRRGYRPDRGDHNGSDDVQFYL